MKIPNVQIAVLGEDLEMTTRACKFKQQGDKLLCADIDAVDYYGEFRGGLPWIAPELIEWAESQGGYWEWENPEAICFTK